MPTMHKNIGRRVILKMWNNKIQKQSIGTVVDTCVKGGIRYYTIKCDDGITRRSNNVKWVKEK